MIDIENLKSHWTHFERPFELLSQWDCGRGILFTAHDSSADDAVKVTVKPLAPDTTFDLGWQTVAAWRKETEILRTNEHQGSLLEPTPQKICIIALHLDEFSESFHADLKGLFERSKRPFCCLASATDPDRIPGYLRSHFFECHKIGRPREE